MLAQELPLPTVIDNRQSSSDECPITSVHTGCRLTVTHVDAAAEDSVRLKRIGVCEGRSLQLLQDGDPIIVKVVGSRVGISRQLASQVLVRQSDD